MKSIEAPQKTNLYETDYILWIEEQVKALSEHNEKALDWYNLKEEINSLGKEQINAIHSFLKQIIIHRLKLDDFQDEIERRLTKTLLNKINLETEYERAKRKVLRLYNVKLPDVCPYTFEELMRRFPYSTTH